MRNLFQVVRLTQAHPGRLVGVLALAGGSACAWAASSLALGAAFDRLADGPTAPLSIVVGAAAVAGAGACGAWLGLAGRWLGGDLVHRAAHSLRVALRRRFAGVRLEHYWTTRVGEPQSILTEIDRHAPRLAETVPLLVEDVAVAATSVVTMLLLDARLALIALALLAIFVLSYRRVAAGRTVAARDSQRGAAHRMHHAVQWLAFRAALHARTANRDAALVREFGVASADAGRIELRSTMLGERAQAVMSTAIVVLSALTLAGFGLYATSASVGTVAAFISLQARLLGTATGLLDRLGRLAEAGVLLQRARAALELPLERVGGLRRARISGAVALQEVWFEYPGGMVALRDVSIAIEPGERVAVMGPSGAGKSTLALLLVRALDPSRGVVSLDGIDLQRLDPVGLREAVALAPQEAFVSHDSVLDNLTMGRPIRMPRVIEVTAALGIHERIEQLSRGYHTTIGPSTFSGGQRHRFGVARALLSWASVLVLDEPTRGLDDEGARQVLQAVSEHAAGRTVIEITHRPPDPGRADRIVVLRAGRIVPPGQVPLP